MKKSILFALALVGVLAVTLFLSCVESGPPRKAYIKDGKKYGVVRGAFRHRWWNYLERGLSYADGAFYKEAAADLKEAIRQRDKDQRMARTYGMHFIDYFPHRELGIVYYEMEDLEEAKKELELSLSHFASAKARFYLDRVRKSLLEKESREVTPPTLSLSLETKEIWTRDDPFILRGVAEDDRYVSGVTIKGVPLFLEGAQQRIPFEEKLQLAQGRHVIEVSVKNLLGKETSQQVIIHVDREGPMITLDEIKVDGEGADKIISIKGSIYDEAGIASLSIDGEPLSVKEEIEVFFEKKFKLQKDELLLAAKDRLGNQTSAGIPARESTAERFPVRIASNDPVMAHTVLAAIFGSKDKNPPIIKLKGWTDNQTVYLDKVYIEGKISDESKIESLKINQVPTLRRKGQNIFFSHLAELKEGKNSINIEAQDEAENKSSKTITVLREVPQALQLEERMSLTVMPFEQKASLSEGSLMYQDYLINALVNENRFRIIERDKLDVILQEQKLSQTKLIDRKTALKLGKLVAAQSILTGSIIETRTGTEIVGRLIDTETSEILATQDVYDEAKDPQAMKALAEGMAIKFHREFPLLEGIVIQKKGKYVFTDLGKDKVKLQRRLIVYREEVIKHPVSGKVMGADNIILSRAKVTQVLPEMSKAEILDDKTEPIKRLDKVITE